MLSVCEVPKPITFGADPSLWPRLAWLVILRQALGNVFSTSLVEGKCDTEAVQLICLIVAENQIQVFGSTHWQMWHKTSLEDLTTNKETYQKCTNNCNVPRVITIACLGVPGLVFSHRPPILTGGGF